jgi:hypothetical protein
MSRTIGLALAFLVLAAPGLRAQSAATGNVYGSVADSSGAALPGVAITLSSSFGSRATVSGGQGEFRFLGLDAGHYRLTLGLSGFASVVREIVVATGDNVELAFQMVVAGPSETVTVSAETPLVSTKKRGTLTTMTTDELQRVPNPRDPWGVLRSVPGVLLDRVNIAGNENGQQASFVGKGGTKATWTLDGLDITDESSGGPVSYFDFGAFEEISVRTTGADVQTQGAGIGMNLVTKRGTNRFHGSARYLISHDSLQRSNLPAELVNDPRLQNPDGSYRDKADHIQQITDYGFELGGPVLKDKLWFYGTWGKQDIRLVRLVGTADKTLIPGYNAKLNWQATPRTMVSLFHFRAAKEKYGRFGGSGLQEADSFLHDQTFLSEKGGLPGGLWKLEVNQTFSPSFFVTATAAYFDTGFGLIPHGPADQSYTLDYDKGVAYGTNLSYAALRPQKQLDVDGHRFFTGLGGQNELKFGFSYRRLVTTSSTHFNGNQLVGIVNSPSDRVAQLWRDATVEYGGHYYGTYLSDVWTRDRLSVNAGLRWDVQRARNLPSTAPANASFPELLPEVDYAGDPGDIVRWSDLSPRVGLSYALDAARRTVLRASYARYVDPLYFSNVVNENPTVTSLLAYGWTDRNGDGFVQPDEVNLDDFLYSENVDPANPAALGSTANKLDRGWKPPRADEVVVGLDHELVEGFAVGAAYTWRRTSDLDSAPLLAGPCSGEPTAASCPVIGPADYTANPPVTANGFTAFTWSPDPALVAAGGGGRLTTNRPGYHQSFSGLELTALKRLSHRWMTRVAFSWNDWEEHFDGPGPKVSYYGNPTPQELDPLVDGGQVVRHGSGKPLFGSVKWQVYGSALVQLPWQLALSGAYFARQGAPYPKSLRLRAGADGTIAALAQDRVDVDRYPTVSDLDLRLAKTIEARAIRLILSVEWFNVMNAGTVLSRYAYVNGAAFTSPEPGQGQILEIMNPSIFRLGATLSF